MFQRLLSKSIPCTRLFRVNTIVSLSATESSDSSKAVSLSSAPETAVKEITETLFLGNTKLPEYTMGGFPERMTEVHEEFVRSMTTLPGGPFSTTFLKHITVYTWGEYASLTDAANVTQLSPTSFKIEAFDPTFSSLIEVALKKSSYGFNVTRDFGVLIATFKDEKILSKEFADKALTQSLNFHKEKLNQIFDQAKLRFTKHPEAVQKLSQLRTDLFNEMENFKSVRLGGVKA